jgi:carboxyl-terminal processing protease
MKPGLGEQAARWAVFGFLVLALLTLAVALGYGIKDIRTDESSSPATTDTGVRASGGAASAALLDEICQVLENQHVDRTAISSDNCRNAAINGIIASLNDPHTSYISPDDLRSGALDLNSTYQGIGASVSGRDGNVQIVSPFRDSPAEAAGIRAGDLILEVDGEPADGWTDQEAVTRIRGPKGTEVTLTVKHTDGSIETITVTRGDIQIESVFTVPNLEPIPGESGDKLVDREGNEVTDIGYVNIAQFHERTLDEFRTKMADAESKGYKGLILDVRSNPGGLLGATVEVVDEFLEKGTILSENDANGKQQSWTAKPGGLVTHLPIVILQDQASASGAEVLAAALQDNGRATVVGTRSFGKGTVNQLIRLKSCGQPDCGAVYVAVGRWLTPKGSQIEGLGVKPDVELPMSSDEYIDQGDIQLFMAIDILRGN